MKLVLLGTRFALTDRFSLLNPGTRTGMQHSQVLEDVYCLSDYAITYYCT
jgi:hypothetical protein